MRSSHDETRPLEDDADEDAARAGPPHMTPAQFRRWGHSVVDWVARYMENVASYPVLSSVEPNAMRAQLPAHAPARGEPRAHCWGRSRPSRRVRGVPTLS